jgi:ABC-2 type transport system ATP-binding protein
MNAPSSTHPMIDIRQVSRWFGTTCAVSNLGFHVNAGEVFGFIGPNGAGKTTTMRILATLDLPDTGDALVDGFSVVNDPDRVRGRLGFMPDAYGSYPNVNCEEYLDFFARTYGLIGKDRLKAMRRVLGFTQLDQMATKPIDGLSKGMKQRLCLGRALIHDPAVLILDEPAAGLDPRARIELRDMVGELASEGKSVLVSSHILTELAEICDRVAIIEQGRLLATGSVDEILNKSRKLESNEDVALVATFISATRDAATWLEGQEQVRDVSIRANEVTFTCPDDPQFQSALLKSLIEQGFPLTRFSGKQHSLEDAFLHVTEGRVQ